jgi:hypothetical protein
MDAVSITLQFFFNRQRTVLMGLTLSSRAQSGLTLSLLPVALDPFVKKSIMRIPPRSVLAFRAALCGLGWVCSDRCQIENHEVSCAAKISRSAPWKSPAD